jgi:sterol desaturase/sphingolipid hydroxylase (fatty acid hydroxylase superfamily)
VAEAQGAGLLRLPDLQYWLAVLAGVVVLDLAIYLQHLLFHAVPALWRLHRVHHADPDFDVTTALRFHPVEILLSMFIKAAVIFAFGPPVLAVLIFEVVLNGASVFNHANVRLPARIERILRWLVVTPDMHRVHHSTDMRETNSNYGFNLSIWHLPRPAAARSYRDADRRHRTGECATVGESHGFAADTFSPVGDWPRSPLRSR